MAFPPVKILKLKMITGWDRSLFLSVELQAIKPKIICQGFFNRKLLFFYLGGEVLIEKMLI